ncbi:TonB-dependent receptor [Alcanivorax sp. 521-1]|uniref:TonB-dependent receptor n=1 Tax=Alloalcanivorax profundimaris TaxID=2735259 RepID=A0ABS0AVS0_9GAMM|nr:TonB-dependent receptor [Alloalcanivorax profundimaris]MBF5058229.1 TonB-dependent receptor [Alloalcanivorax profundimaris]
MALTFSRRLGGAGLALMLLSPVLHAQSDTPEAPLTAPAERAYDLPAQPLRAALLRFAEQAGVDLIVGAADLDGQRSRPLKGRYSVDGALDTLLAGTGLGYRTDQQAESGRVTVRLIPAPPAQSAAHQLEDVVVSAARGHTVAGKSPRKITMISRQQIEEQMAISDDPGAVLANLIPSYSPSRQKLSNTGETFRGRTPQFLIDGVPQSNPLRNGGRASHTIDLSMVERIEVIHGASAEYGLGATGGIINFVTRRPEKPGFQQHVGVSLTSDDDFQSDGLGHKLDYRFTGQTERWDIVAAASRQERGLFYDGRDRAIGFAYPGEIQDSTSHDLFLKAGYWLDDNQNITFSANRFELEGDHDYRAVPGDLANDIPTSAEKGGAEGEPMFNKVTTTRLSYSHGNWLGNELDAQVYYQDFEGQFGALRSGSFQDPALAPVGTLLDQTRNESEKMGSQFTLKRQGLLRDHLDLATGFDVLSDETRQSLVLTDRVYVPETEYRNYAGFVQLDLRPLDRLAFSGGARYEYAKLKVDDYRTVEANNGVLVRGGDPDFDEMLYNIGATYQFTDQVQLFANYSEGFGMPDVGRVLRGIDETGQDVDNLLALKPIVTDNREVGLRFNGERTRFEVSYFESDSDYGERLTEENGVFVVNREKVEIKGVEATLDWRVTDAHELGLTYTHQEGESDTDGDGDVDTTLNGLSVAPDRVGATWNARWNDTLRSFVQVNHYRDRSFDQDDLDFDGYTLVDASLVRALPVGRVKLGVENLFDKDYVTYYSQAGRVSPDFYFTGRGRVYSLGYSVDF